MALTKPISKQVDYISNFDDDVISKIVDFPATYIRIENVRGNKDNLRINVVTYTDGSKQKVLAVNDYAFVPSVEDDAKNFIEQGYIFLKGLEEYSDAQDC